MEAWEHLEIIQSRIGQPLSPLEKRLAETMHDDYDARHQEPTEEESR